MTRFYFDISNGNGFHRDDFGDEWGNLEEAAAQARLILFRAGPGAMPRGDHHEISCAVRDVNSRIVYRAEMILQGRWVS